MTDVQDRAKSPAMARRVPRRRQRLRLILVFVVLAAALGFLLAEGLGSSLDYFETVHQALAKKATLGTSTFRLEGLVVRGTVHESRHGAEFMVATGSQRVVVDNTGSPPELFQPGIPVVVVGHFASVYSDTFLSNEIMVKHTPTYIAAHPNRVRGVDGKVVK